MLAPKVFLDHIHRENKNYKQTNNNPAVIGWNLGNPLGRTSICNGPAFPSGEEIDIYWKAHQVPGFYHNE